MRIKDLFTVPQGERVTEKAFGRVLVSSVCSILLCMACLFGTTWAWFVAGIENTGNVIQIANVELEVTAVPEGESSAVTGNSQTLTAGVYDLRIEIRNEAAGNEAGAKHPVYVIMTTSENKSWCWKFEEGLCVVEPCLEIGADTVSVNFTVSWIQPDGAVPVGATERVLIGVTQNGLSEAPSTEAAAVTKQQPAPTQSDVPEA